MLSNVAAYRWAEAFCSLLFAVSTAAADGDVRCILRCSAARCHLTSQHQISGGMLRVGFRFAGRLCGLGREFGWWMNVSPGRMHAGRKESKKTNKISAGEFVFS